MSQSYPGIYLFKDGNYSASWGGPFIEGNYTLADLQSRGVQNNDVSSVRIVNNNDGSYYSFTLYSADNFTGDTFTASTDTPRLGPLGFNDKTTSMRVTLNSPNTNDNVVRELYIDKHDASVSLSMVGTGTYVASGFFFKHTGTNPGLYIGTCAHCVLDTGSNRNTGPYFTLYASITNFNNTGIDRVFKTKIIGMAGYADIAVLELVDKDDNPLPQSNLQNQQFFSWAADDSYKSGDACYVIGDPGGLDACSITGGHIRDPKNPDALYIPNVWTDCDIMGGNSGSAIIDRDGDIIGIISYGYSSTELNFGASAEIIKLAFTYICNNRTSTIMGSNYVGGTISQTPNNVMTLLSPVNSWYCINASNVYQSQSLGYPLTGFYVASGDTTGMPGTGTNNIITTIEGQEIGVYQGQITPKAIYIATGGIENATPSVSSQIKNFANDNTTNVILQVRAIPPLDDVYMGHSFAPANSLVHIIKPLERTI